MTTLDDFLELEIESLVDAMQAAGESKLLYDGRIVIAYERTLRTQGTKEQAIEEIKSEIAPLKSKLEKDPSLAETTLIVVVPGSQDAAVFDEIRHLVSNTLGMQTRFAAGPVPPGSVAYRLSRDAVIAKRMRKIYDDHPTDDRKRLIEEVDKRLASGIPQPALLW